MRNTFFPSSVEHPGILGLVPTEEELERARKIVSWDPYEDWQEPDEESLMVMKKNKEWAEER